MSLKAMITDIGFKRLRAENALELSRLLQSAPSSYSRYFVPFDFSLESIATILKQAKKDIYFGIEVGGVPAGFYILRGFDQGYRVPAYGVWIAPKYKNCGLAALTLAHAFAICKLNRIGRLMLKVHPKNIKALKLYEKMGFVRTDVDPKNSNFVYHKSFQKKKGRSKS